MSRWPPLEPPPSRAAFPDVSRPGVPEVIGVGNDFTAGTLLAAYRRGIFPWPHKSEDVPPRELVLWFSPEPRCIFPLDGEPHWSRSLRRTLRKHPYEVTVDADFEQVIRACGETRPEGTWIIPELIAGYVVLHELGWAHSVEVWERTPRGERLLVGGIYGVSIGGLFAGESMFHRRTDASKIAFASLVERLRNAGFELFDVQVRNDHLASLGCIEIPRSEYLRRTQHAVKQLPKRLA